MNVNKLNNGKVFNNYKTMCAELEIEIKSSTNSKNAQFKELAQYCKFHKDGHKIIIDEVFEEPLDKVDGRGHSEGSRRDIYGNLVQLLIADILAQCDGHISISRSWLMQQLGMTNVNYSPLNENVRKLSKYADIGEKVIYDFYNTSNSNFKSIIETALDNLMDKRVIMYNKIIKVVDNELYAHPRNATEIELELIMDIEKEILEEMGYKRMSHVRISKDWRKFKYKTNKKLTEDCDLKFYFTAYDISINEKYIEEERNNLLDLLLESTKRENCKNELNKTVLANVKENARKRHDKAQSFTSNKYTKFRKNESYLDEIDKLAKLLIDRNTYDITYKVSQIQLDSWGIDITNDPLWEELFA